MFLAAALLLFRTGATERAEIPDAGGAVESIFFDDATVPVPVATVEPRGRRSEAVSDSPISLGRLFVSEIFRPPTSPLFRTSPIAVKTE